MENHGFNVKMLKQLVLGKITTFTLIIYTYNVIKYLNNVQLSSINLVIKSVFNKIRIFKNSWCAYYK